MVADSTALLDRAAQLAWKWRLCRLQRLAADRAVARAQLVGLQRIEDTQHFLDIAADREVVDAGEADDAVRIDDEGRAQGDTLIGVEHAASLRQLALDVGQPGKRA